jgi:hypothetical protein
MSSRARKQTSSALAVGVTGHRPHRLGTLQLARLLPQARDVLRELASASSANAKEGLTLYSALAEGADRHLARLGLEGGCTLHAVLPFTRDDYAADFDSAESRREYRELLERAQHVDELAGDRRHADLAYERAGHAILDMADLLIAVWDGAPSRGRGGTGAVVAEAWRRRLPIVHLSTQAHAQPTLLHAEGGRVSALDMQQLPDRPLNAAALRALIAARLAARHERAH